jgi:hypothetical protein
MYDKIFLVTTFATQPPHFVPNIASIQLLYSIMLNRLDHLPSDDSFFEFAANRIPSNLLALDLRFSTSQPCLAETMLQALSI